MQGRNSDFIITAQKIFFLNSDFLKVILRLSKKPTESRFFELFFQAFWKPVFFRRKPDAFPRWGQFVDGGLGVGRLHGRRGIRVHQVETVHRRATNDEWRQW